MTKKASSLLSRSYRYVVIMAGGSGARLWPESRQKDPKQFKSLAHPQMSLLQETYVRIKDLVLPDHIFVSTVSTYVEIVRQQLPDVPLENIIVEPCCRDTAPALAYVAHHLYKINPEAVIFVTPSDHTVKEVGLFADTVRTMFQVVDHYPERVGLMGIKTIEPNTMLGYIRKGNEIKKRFPHAVYRVDSFAEKPTEEKAKEYFTDLDYFWNAGCAIFCANTLLEQIAHHVPEITRVLSQIDACENTQECVDLFSTLLARSIDFAVWERLADRELFVVPASLTWSDVGNWRALHKYHRGNAPDQNYARGSVHMIDTANSFVFGGNQTVVTFGVKDLIVVSSGNVVLVADRTHVEDMKKVIAFLKDRGHRDIL